MRHAKSSWDFPDLVDFERPLNKRGIESSKKICERFVKNKIFFDLILTSSSKRTLETLSYLNGPAEKAKILKLKDCLLYTSPSPRDGLLSRMPSSA